MTTTESVLNKIKEYCKRCDSCKGCRIDMLLCGYLPKFWTDKDIKEIVDILDDFEREEVIGQNDG